MKSTDLGKLIQNELEKQLSPDALQKKIAEGVKKLVDKLMDEEVFGHWGVVQKEATEFVKEKMNVKFDQINLLPMCKAITNQFQSHIAHWDETERVEALKTMADIILGKAPESMKLSGLCEMIKDTFGKDEDDCTCDYGEGREITIAIGDRTYGSKDLVLEWKDQWDKPFKLEAMYSDSGHLFYIRYNDKQLEKSIEMKEVDGWLGTLLAIQQHDVDFSLDMDDEDTFALEEVND